LKTGSLLRDAPIAGFGDNRPIRTGNARAGLYAQSVVIGGIAPLEEYAVFTKIGPVVGDTRC